MGAGNPTISRETETQVPAVCEPQPRQPHIIKLISQLQKPTRKISDTWIIDTDKSETRYQLVKVYQTVRQPHTCGICLSLTSLSTIIPRSIHDAANVFAPLHPVSLCLASGPVPHPHPSAWTQWVTKKAPDSIWLNPLTSLSLYTLTFQQPWLITFPWSAFFPLPWLQWYDIVLWFFLFFWLFLIYLHCRK